MRSRGAVCLAAVGLMLVLPRCDHRARPKKADTRLGLPLFYAGHHSATNSKGKVDDLSEPEMGWITHGKPVPNPTKVATQGLQAVLDEDVVTARLCADWLLAHSNKTGDAISFPFEFDFVPYWPFELRAPWSSAITQGLALGLFTQLYLVEKREDDLARARQIASFYYLPIEKGGFTRFERDGAFFEEYPTTIPTRVLNGALIAGLALRDYGIAAHDDRALSLFESSVDRLDTLLPEYEFYSAEDDCTLSSYSLAPIRPRLLMRFAGAGQAFISSIRFVGKKSGGKSQSFAELRVGSNDDSKPMRLLYIWDDPKFMNWGPSTKRMVDGREVIGRVAGEHKGEFDHSPFVLGWLDEYDQMKERAIEVDYVPLAGATVAATVYDGVEYWPLGTLTGEQGRMKTGHFPIPAAFPLDKLRVAAKEARVDIRYLDDNQRLVELVGDLAGDDEIMKRAARWKESCLVVPARWMNWINSNPLIDAEKEPLAIPSNGLRLRGQPAALRVGKTWHLYYTATDSGGPEQIYQASSEDGNIWELHGQVFADGGLPTGAQTAHPTVLEVPGAPPESRFIMAFTVNGVTGATKARLSLARSADADRWTYDRQFEAEDVSDPLLLPDGRGGSELYYVPVAQSSNANIMVSRSNDTRTWTKPTVSVRQGLHSAHPRDLGVSGLLFAGRTILILEVSARNNRHSLLFARGADGQFHSCPQNPIYVCDDWNERWDAIRFDWCFLPDGHELFYAGAAKREFAPTDLLLLGRAKVKSDVMEKLLANVDQWPRVKTDSK